MYLFSTGQLNNHNLFFICNAEATKNSIWILELMKLEQNVDDVIGLFESDKCSGGPTESCLFAGDTT